MGKVSEEEARMMKHALGWPKDYRNYFALFRGSPAHDVWESLADRGLALRGEHKPTQQLIGYAVSESGRAALQEDK